ncbi:Dabb family protein [Saccharomonospora sp. NPDC046836]|uniref:Dabb family protein n=1 Tax=Saccharomonospora sp. NPDC046836 TaxID=3156921 RepID=UPI0033C91EE1
MNGEGVLHIVSFTWNDNATAQQIDEIEQSLRNYARRAPGILSFHCGRDIGLVDGNVDFGVAASFPDETAFKAYREHPDHQEIVRAIIPLLARSSGLQMRSSADPSADHREMTS